MDGENSKHQANDTITIYLVCICNEWTVVFIIIFGVVVVVWITHVPKVVPVRIILIRIVPGEYVIQVVPCAVCTLADRCEQYKLYLGLCHNLPCSTFLPSPQPSLDKASHTENTHKPPIYRFQKIPINYKLPGECEK